MEKRQKGHCRQCKRDVGEVNLSNQKLCYDCAKANMLAAFNWSWHWKRERLKEEVK